MFSPLCSQCGVIIFKYKSSHHITWKNELAANSYHADYKDIDSHEIRILCVVMRGDKPSQSLTVTNSYDSVSCLCCSAWYNAAGNVYPHRCNTLPRQQTWPNDITHSRDTYCSWAEGRHSILTFLPSRWPQTLCHFLPETQKHNKVLWPSITSLMIIPHLHRFL